MGENKWHYLPSIGKPPSTSTAERDRTVTGRTFEKNPICKYCGKTITGRVWLLDEGGYACTHCANQ